MQLLNTICRHITMTMVLTKKTSEMLIILLLNYIDIYIPLRREYE
jgi:hypothetical protein